MTLANPLDAISERKEERELLNISGVPWLVNESTAIGHGDLRLEELARRVVQKNDHLSAAGGSKLKRIYFCRFQFK
jgi:hypothetical protein